MVSTGSAPENVHHDDGGRSRRPDRRRPAAPRPGPTTGQVIAAGDEVESGPFGLDSLAE
jgi:hypothetical protein